MRNCSFKPSNVRSLWFGNVILVLFLSFVCHRAGLIVQAAETTTNEASTRPAGSGNPQIGTIRICIICVVSRTVIICSVLNCNKGLYDLFLPTLSLQQLIVDFKHTMIECETESKPFSAAVLNFILQFGVT